ncbi:DUF2147 domain-containing protein [Pseudorhodoferax sp.]|uniref:DUF2147 domain-containing protein n=1 Tax=Pseudorhodoferax sp. TaxID=1993553 RepID=UPI002DD67C6E|nr:DUF2147 domain-containing protein [Pseudorhodoferax sp.]
MKPLLLALACCTPLAALAQMTPVGRWNSVDDMTGEPKAQMQIVERDGQLTGRIVQVLRKDADPQARCTACTDERKDRPLVGLELIRGAQKATGKEVWEGGNILDPESGRVYTLRLTPIEGGRKLEVRGSFGPFSRTQTWLRQP